MKKLNSMFLVTALSLLESTIVKADMLQDVISQFTNLTKRGPLPATPRGKANKDKVEDSSLSTEHAQKLAQKTSLKAVEAANLSLSAIKNVALHLQKTQEINRVAEYLNNVVSGRGNSLEQTEKAKQLLHEILSEARQLEKNAHESTKQLEKTLRLTAKLDKRLQSMSQLLNNPTLSKIWNTIKTQAKNRKD